MRSPYLILGIKKSAEPQAIKTAYRMLAKTWHPDQNRHDPEASRRFAEITQAYRLLMDPELRALFDQGRIDANGRRRRSESGFAANPFSVFQDAWKTRPGGRKGDTAKDKEAGKAEEAAPEDRARPSDFDAMVDHIFGDAARMAAGEAARRGRRAAGTAAEAGPTRRADQPEDDTLSVLDALFARWKEIHGQEPPEPAAAAETNHIVEIPLAAVLTGARLPIRIDDQREIMVDIPAGTADGTILPVAGAAGEIKVTVRHQAHPLFRAEGEHLFTEAAVELAEAVLGGSIVVEALDGPVRINLPEWSTGGTPFVVEGRGLPQGDGKRGDLHVFLRIRLPGTPDDQLVDLMRTRRKSWYV